MIENKEIIKTLELCVTAIKVIHPILDPDEPCIAWEATQEAKKLIKELQALDRIRRRNLRALEININKSIAGLKGYKTRS